MVFLRYNHEFCFIPHNILQEYILPITEMNLYQIQKLAPKDQYLTFINLCIFHFKMCLRSHYYPVCICCLEHSVQLLTRWTITVRFFFFFFLFFSGVYNAQTSELQYSGHGSSDARTSQQWSSFQAVSYHLFLQQTLRVLFSMREHLGYRVS